VVHPDWFTAPALRGNSKRLGLAPPAEDIALVWLTESPQQEEGISPAPIVGAGELHGETVVAINTWTSSMRCAGPSYSYRLDAPTAQEFLNTYL